MYVLAVDSSSVSGSVALLNDEQVLFEEIIHTGLNHSQTLLPAVAELFARTGRKISDIDLFAVTTGPGSFTGLRIGVSLIKGFALATSKPVAGVSTLEALSQNLFACRSVICPFMDAKKKQVYAALFNPRPDGVPEKIREETVEDPRRFLETITTEIVLAGDGAMKYADLLEEILPGRYVIAPPPFHLIRASVVGLLAFKKYGKRELLDVMTLSPQYIRFSEAERKVQG